MKAKFENMRQKVENMRNARQLHEQITVKDDAAVTVHTNVKALMKAIAKSAHENK